MPSKITLEQFVRETLNKLGAFETYHRKGMELCPKNYPERQLAGDWDEQFAMFTPGDPHFDTEGNEISDGKTG